MRLETAATHLASGGVESQADTTAKVITNTSPCTILFALERYFVALVRYFVALERYVAPGYLIVRLPIELEKIKAAQITVNEETQAVPPARCVGLGQYNPDFVSLRPHARARLPTRIQPGHHANSVQTH